MNNRFVSSPAFTGPFALLLLAAISCLSAPLANGGVTVVIQPNEAGTAWVCSVTWSAPEVVTNSESFNLEDSIDGSTLSGPTVNFADNSPEAPTATVIEWNGTASTRLDWVDVGNHIVAGTPYDNDAFAAGHGNVSMLVGSNYGVYWDDDPVDGTGLDDFSIIVPFASPNLPTSGSFVITGLLPEGTFTSRFNVGSWSTVNSINASTDTVTVTTTPYVVPEPSALALLGLSGLVLLRRRRK